MENDAIVVENLVKTYANGIQALTGVSFRVSPGEIFGLLGPNGAGKSTTVRILATLTRSDAGRATVAGHDVTTEAYMVRKRIGYVAQASGVDKWATGRENLALQAHLDRVPPAEIPARVRRGLEWVGLAEAADRVVKTYSGGMKRRLDLAMGLIHDPAVLFLDEPTTGLDPETRSALWRDLQRLRQERRLTVLLTTHYLEEADYLCDRLAIVDQGRVVVTGTPSELKAQIRGDAVALQVAGDAGRAAEVLRPADGVLKVMADGPQVVAWVAQGATALPALITALERAGVAVQAATVGRPTLNDVYLHYTGHRYASGGDPAGGKGEA